MHGHKHLKKIFRISFSFLQILLFTFGTFSSILFTSLYIKEKSLFHLPFRVLIYSQVFSLLFVAISVLGYECYYSKKTYFRILYTLTSLFLMNYILLVNNKINKIIEKISLWADKRWSALSEVQIDFVEKTLNCCGYWNMDDRNLNTCTNMSCEVMIRKLAKVFRNYIGCVCIGLFFIISMGIAISMIISTKKRKNNETE